ncbi:MAG TPA: outer membrane beta-barrel protein [Vicinamibacterales bacterium]|nr:outer membrane beta-barrel protein [Vicinamibacterales bacterium]
MKQLVIMALVAVFVGVGTARAQTPGASEDIGYAEVTFGPTFGHKTSGSVGGEAGLFLGSLGPGRIGVFGEAGRMANIATSEIETKAQTIAGAFNATFQAKQPATYFDGGVVMRFSPQHHFTPYALVGIGGATVSNKVTFAVGGTDVTSRLNQFGVQLGGDLTGSYTKVFVTVGAGAHVTLMDRWIADVSYRYGRVGQDTVSSQVIYKGFNTGRLQFGAGVKF